MRGAQGSHGPVLIAKEVHCQRNVADGPVGKARLFKNDGRAVILYQKIGDCTGLKLDIDWPADAQHLATLLKMLKPPP